MRAAFRSAVMDAATSRSSAATSYNTPQQTCTLLQCTRSTNLQRRHYTLSASWGARGSRTGAALRASPSEREILSTSMATLDSMMDCTALRSLVSASQCAYRTIQI